MAALLNKRARTTVQEVSVDELTQCCQAFLTAKKDRDLAALLERGWKSAPSVALPAFVAACATHLSHSQPCIFLFASRTLAFALAAGYDLFASLLQRCGPVLSSQKTLLALVSLHDDKPCNFTRQPTRAWADLLSASVRACPAKLRERAYNSTLQERKATVQQASALQGLAAMVRHWDDKGPTLSAWPLALAQPPAQVLAPAVGADAATDLGDDGGGGVKGRVCRGVKGRPPAHPPVSRLQ
ncbi:unnamed protein product, partial [Effrenium voratum]